MVTVWDYRPVIRRMVFHCRLYWKHLKRPTLLKTGVENELHPIGIAKAQSLSTIRVVTHCETLRTGRPATHLMRCGIAIYDQQEVCHLMQNSVLAGGTCDVDALVGYCV